jgi:threonine/homoserine/homoserine lactone efflux protein
MNTLFALAAFGLIAAATPGPNNIILWASGVKFGFKATLPHVVGTALGLGVIAAASAAGVGALIETFPQIELALKIIGSIYLLYLSYQVAGIGSVRQAEAERPLSLPQAMAFQFVNPKAWFFALTAVSSFRPPEFSVLLGSALVVLTMIVVILPGSTLWAAGGTLINRFISNERTRRVFSIVLALMLVGTVVFIWL